MVKIKRRKEEAIMKTMIYLNESVHLRLKHKAVDERTSMAELVRRSIDLYLKSSAKKGGRRK